MTKCRVRHLASRTGELKEQGVTRRQNLRQLCPVGLRQSLGTGRPSRDQCTFQLVLASREMGPSVAPPFPSLARAGGKRGGGGVSVGEPPPFPSPPPTPLTTTSAA